MPPSDWFWCGQPPSVLLSCHSISGVHLVPTWSQCLCSTSFLPLFGPPCSGMSIRALSFVVVLLGCTSPLGRASSYVLSCSRIPMTWPGPTVVLHAGALAHQMPQVPCLGLCGGNGAPLHLQESTFAGSIFLMLVFDHACRPLMVRFSGLPGKTSESLLLMLPLISPGLLQVKRAALRFHGCHISIAHTGL